MPPPRIVVAKPSHTLALPALLLAVACGVAGCRDDRPAAAEGTTAAPAPVVATPSATAPSPAPATPPGDTVAPVPPPADTGIRIPEALRGVWYPDTDQGRADCKAYRIVTPKQFQEGPGGSPLIGATIILGGLVHQFSEYGEGTFYDVRDLQRISDGHWRLVSRYWIDSYPGIDSPDDPSDQFSIDGLALIQNRLSWYPAQSSAATGLTGQPDGPALFRCGPVRPEIYPVASGED